MAPTVEDESAAGWICAGEEHACSAVNPVQISASDGGFNFTGVQRQKLHIMARMTPLVRGCDLLWNVNPSVEFRSRCGFLHWSQNMDPIENGHGQYSTHRPIVYGLCQIWTYIQNGPGI